MLRFIKKPLSLARRDFVGEQVLASPKRTAADVRARRVPEASGEAGDLEADSAEIAGLPGRGGRAETLERAERVALGKVTPATGGRAFGSVTQTAKSAFLPRNTGRLGSPRYDFQAAEIEAANGRGLASSGCGTHAPVARVWFVARTRIRQAGARAARMGRAVLREWARRYAVALGITAVLHAALFLSPGGDGAGGKAAGGDAATDEGVFVLPGGPASASADAANGGAQAGATGMTGAAADEAPPMSAGEIAAAVSALAAGELAQFQTDAMARADVFDPDAFAGAAAGGGFDALAGARSALAGGGLGRTFGGGAFSLARVAGAGGGRAGRPGAGMAAIFMPEPFYPELARRERREGVVELDVVIGGSGRASAVTVTRSSGHEDLDNVARATVLTQWRFARAAAGAEARQCVVMIEFNLRRG